MPVMVDPAVLTAMGKAAAAFAITDGDERLADLVAEAVAEAGARSGRALP